jgi:hypothetical protein
LAVAQASSSSARPGFIGFRKNRESCIGSFLLCGIRTTQALPPYPAMAGRAAPAEHFTQGHHTRCIPYGSPAITGSARAS